MTGHGVASLNSDEMRKLLKQLDPDVVAVYSTGILSLKTLAAVGAPLNSTITPASIQNIAGSIRPIGRSSRGTRKTPASRFMLWMQASIRAA